LFVAHFLNNSSWLRVSEPTFIGFLGLFSGIDSLFSSASCFFLFVSALSVFF